MSLAIVAEVIGVYTLKQWAEICKQDEKRMMVGPWVQIQGLAQKAGNGVSVREGSTSNLTARQSRG